MVPIFELLWAFGLVFVTCELAGRITTEFESINDQINQFDWYLFPLEEQQKLPFLMANTQNKVGFKCFGSAMCERDTFKKVRYWTKINRQ